MTKEGKREMIRKGRRVRVKRSEYRTEYIIVKQSREKRLKSMKPFFHEFFFVVRKIKSAVHTQHYEKAFLERNTEYTKKGKVKYKESSGKNIIDMNA